MPLVTATLKGISAYSQSRQHDDPKLEKERPDDYEKRTWRSKMHVTPDGKVFIPPMAFKNCLDEIAKFLSVRIPGKGKATFTKHFEAGVLVTDGLTLPIKAKDVPGEWLNLDSNGVKGSGKRVKRCFPLIQDWGGNVEFHIFDAMVTEEVFRYHLEEAGKFIGIGRFRPRNRGFYGRFTVEKIKWSAK
jgi:hypothetical protein